VCSTLSAGLGGSSILLERINPQLTKPYEVRALLSWGSVVERRKSGTGQELPELSGWSFWLEDGEVVFHSRLVSPLSSLSLFFPNYECSTHSILSWHISIFWALCDWAGGLGLIFHNVSSLKNISWMTSVCLQLRSGPWHNPWPSFQGCAISTPSVYIFVLEIHKKVNFFISVFDLIKKFQLIPCRTHNLVEPQASSYQNIYFWLHCKRLF